jgi:transposase
MREDDGRKRDHATLEAIRLQAVRAVEAGERPAAVAKSLGMSRSAVYAWLAQARAGGPEALRAKPIAGRPPELSPEQVSRVGELVMGSDPRKLGLPFALWTRELVGELILREFKVELSLATVGRLLARLGLSSPRWTVEVGPTIRAEAAAAGAEINFLMASPAPSDDRGGTLLSARSAPGRRRFAVVPGPLSARTFIDFCDRLLSDARKPLVLIVEDNPMYRSTDVRAYLDSTGVALRPEYLPADAPRRNPEA